MTWKITPSNALVDDQDALTYLAAVETADGQALESGVRLAVNAFVKGCKADGIWPAIKASCILAGARTLSGALVPLSGVAPTNISFVAGDYNRKTGLKGDGSTKYLNSNRPNNADPQNSNHNACYITTSSTQSAINVYIGGGISGTGTNNLGHNGGTGLFIRSRSNTAIQPLGAAPVGFYAISRANASSIIYRLSGGSATANLTSDGVASDSVSVFCRSNSLLQTASHTDARLSFYSIGEALDLALLDTRVTTLINAIAAAIP